MDAAKTLAAAVARFSTFSMLARNAIFQAVKKPVLISNATGELEDMAWTHGDGGDYRVLGRIGQVHSRLFECLFKSTRAHMPLPGGGWNMLVDPAAVRREFEHDYNAGRIVVLRDELALARIQINTPRFSATGTLVEVIVPEAADLPHGVNHFTRAPRPYWFIRTGVVLSALLEHDYCLHIDTPRVSALHSGMAQAIARHLLTQDRDQQPNGGWKLDNLIVKLAPGISDEDIRNRRREVRRDAAGLAALEILTDTPSEQARGQGHRASLRLRFAGAGADDQKRVAEARHAR